MSRSMVDQVVGVTGASSGIGRETALELARHGARVVLAARDRPALDAVAAEVERLGGVALVAPTDVTDEAHVTALADAGPEGGTGRGAGEFGQRSKSVSVYTTVFGLHPVRGRIAAAALLTGAVVVLRRLGRRR